MARLICTGITSLDGFINDREGNFDWSMPDPEVHQFVNDQERAIGTHLLGRRLYEVMKAWDSDALLADNDPVAIDYANIWRATDKVVFSTTLRRVDTPRTRLERRLDLDEVRTMKRHATRDLAIGGPTFAAKVIEAGLVDEFRLYMSPIAVGAGTPFFPAGKPTNLELADHRRFKNGVVYLEYRPRQETRS